MRELYTALRVALRQSGAFEEAAIMLSPPVVKSKAVQPQRSTVVAKRLSQSAVDLVPLSRRLTVT